MVVEDKLSPLLGEFARTLLTDFPIEAILDRLVDRIVEVLPVTSAGVTLIAPGLAPHYVAASNRDALAYEKLQSAHGEGPCRVAYDTGDAVSVPDLQVDDRFPTFSVAATDAGLKAAFAFPLRHNSGRLGALDLYRDTTGPMDDRDMAVAQTLADVTAAYVLNAHARETALATSDRFRDSALRDPLTGLPNRVLLHQRIAHAAERAGRSRSLSVVLFADLDRFKAVNDSYGHAAGDALLVAVGERLSSLIRPGDTLARVSGDEFVFLCEDLGSIDEAEALAARIDGAFALPFTLATGLELRVGASVGVAYAGPGELISPQLVVDADMAMYQAKRAGGAQHQIIDLRDARHRGQRNTLEQDLHTAFARRELHLAYQPIVRVSDGHVVGAEALLRWNHPERGAVPPLDMVAIAEENGMINALGAWVLQKACTDHRDWNAQHSGRRMELSVNVSVRQVLGPGFTETVHEVLQRTGMDPGSLILEMTEGIVILDAERALTVLTDLKDLGVRIALDDFGTGYSSLSYLRRFPVDVLKVDRSFVSAIGYDKTAAAIVGSICQLGHLLDLQVVAEGVETSEQRNAALDAGCDMAQGYFYAHPMPASQVNEMLPDAPLSAHLPELRGEPHAVLPGVM